MTDRIALVLALLIAAAIGVDVVFNGGVACLFLLRKLLDLVQYVMIWR
ncbi:hypothetical protein GCM10010873_27590 [Cypionkella aquatica]|uniref:Uncharacterized protein n=1 Tax=Cypionkella aquatica TaxID=1756042 RepID=A0AA37X2R5_9RHOB|nr:hypothetical protein [Cypionkella aquatica]GLS87785.1 hypothetical protein GCM10010873_27590 [Cypionkella aquatica]